MHYTIIQGEFKEAVRWNLSALALNPHYFPALYHLGLCLHLQVILTWMWTLELARTVYMRGICGTFGRKITKYTVKYGVYILFWPTLMYLLLPCTLPPRPVPSPPGNTYMNVNFRVGQNRIYAGYMRYFWNWNLLLYGTGTELELVTVRNWILGCP